jgi:hypothetical protein
MVLAVVAWLVWLADTVWRPLLITLGMLGLVGVWQIGRRSGALPDWAAPANGRWMRPWSSPRAGSQPRSRIWESRH